MTISPSNMAKRVIAVESVIIRMKPHRRSFRVLDEKTFSDIVRWLFTQRRRKIRNAILSYLRMRGYEKKEARSLIEGLPYLESRVCMLTPEGLLYLSNEIYQRIVESKKFFYKNSVFYVLPEVYEPSDDTFLLADNLVIKRSSKVLDVGAGCGILSILAAKNASKVVATDLNPHAVECIKINVKLNDVARKVEVRCGDLFEAVKPDEKFDVIIFNPPYLPTSKGEAERGWLEKAWAGGPTGREVIDKFLREVPRYLNGGGKVLLVQSTLSDVAKTVGILEKYGFKPEILAEKKLDFESIKLIQAYLRTDHNSFKIFS